MYILHIETSTAICSVALSRGHQMLACHDMKEGMNHTALLAPAIDEILKSASIVPNDLAAISIGSGPGSYTGLRVGSSTAKAMAYSLGKPVIAIPTLLALAKAAFDKHPDAQFALPMIDARRMEVYTALYDRSLTELVPVSSVILNEEFLMGGLPDTGIIVSCGDGSLKIGDRGKLAENLRVDTTIQCSAAHLVPLALDFYTSGHFEDPMHYVPYYMKPPNITEAKKSGQARS